jgi:hypothetical protein
VVECDLAKVEVAGSTPVSRSINLSVLPLAPARVYALRASTGWHSIRARYPSGKGEVCKTFMRRFDSDPRLQTFQVVMCISDSATNASVAGSVAASGQNWSADTVRLIPKHALPEVAAMGAIQARTDLARRPIESRTMLMALRISSKTCAGISRKTRAILGSN